MFGGNVQNAVIVGDHLYSTVPIMGMDVQFVVKIKIQPVSRNMELWMKIPFRHLATLAEQIMIWREGIYYSLWIETLGMNYKRIKTGYGIKRY